MEEKNLQSEGKKISKKSADTVTIPSKSDFAEGWGVKTDTRIGIRRKKKKMPLRNRKKIPNRKEANISVT